VYQDLLPTGRKRKVPDADQLPERKAILHDLRPGSRLIVSSLDRLGSSGIDITATIRTVTAKGCSVFAVDTCRSYIIPPEIGQVLDDAEAAEATLKRERIQKARAVRAERAAAGVKGVTGGNQGWNPDEATKRQMKDLWLNDLSISRREFKSRYGVSAKVLQDRFGPRGGKAGRPKTTST
jgi:DNA invertase Pin-like site-specific DNA recombinase